MDEHHHRTASLFAALTRIRTEQEAQAFLKDLCTPQEIRAMQERWRVCQLLARGDLSYREIHEQTKASLATIGRVARFLKDEPYKGYQMILKKIKSYHSKGS